MKRDYYDDPEQYFQDKKDSEEIEAKEKLADWERKNPHLPYGYSYTPFKED